MNTLYNLFTEEKWKQVKTHPYFAKSVEATIKRADEMISEHEPELKFSDMHLYVINGSRSEFQGAYTALTNRMNVFYTAYMLSEDEKYIEPLVNTIWNICNMETWALPAHCGEDQSFERRRCWLELVSTKVGFELGEILAAIGDKFPKLVRDRVKKEIRERIIYGYENYDFGWYRSTNNWSAVCVCGVLGAYLYIADKAEIENALPRMMKSADCFLAGFDDDGCCKEGYAYWIYGFKAFCIFAQMLRKYTDGKIDYFKDPKVYAIAKFQENMAINERECIPFSDCGEYFNPDIPLSHLLKSIYPDIQIPSMTLGSRIYTLQEFCLINPEYENSKLSPKSMIYTDAQWFIYRGGNFNFACKAGSNNEPHNHNDIGSFVISKDDKVTFTDCGTGEYTRQYFGPERYTILEPSARSHSVPIINGEYQTVGDKKSEIYSSSENEYEFSMENGYKISSLDSLKRHFVCTDDGVLLTDTYKFSELPESVVERFVSFCEIKCDGDKIVCDNTALIFDKDMFDISFSQEVSVKSKTSHMTLYIVDFKVKKPGKDMTLSFKFI